MRWRLAFLGPPGTGKGTQAQRLARRLGLAALSSGDALRREIDRGTPLGAQVREYLTSGRLVPDALVTGVVLAALDGAGEGGFLLDGFPRTIPQAEILEQELLHREAPLQAVVDFVLDDDEIVARLAGRRVCTKCQATYNARFLPPKVAGVCDACGGALAQRSDDREDVIGTRLKTYRELTAPLIDFYAARGLLRLVNAAASTDDVEQQIMTQIGAS